MNQLQNDELLDTNELTERENQKLNETIQRRRYYNVLFNFNTNNEFKIKFHALAIKECNNFNEYEAGYTDSMDYSYHVIWKNKFLVNLIEDEYEILT